MNQDTKQISLLLTPIFPAPIKATGCTIKMTLEESRGLRIDLSDALANDLGLCPGTQRLLDQLDTFLEA